MASGVILLASSGLLPLGAEALAVSGEKGFVLMFRKCVKLLVPGFEDCALDDPVWVSAKADCADQELLTLLVKLCTFSRGSFCLWR